MREDKSNSNEKLLETYVLGAWFVKIRLMSSRRQLWASETSLINLENAALQLRKICEMLGYMCLAAAGIENFTLSKQTKPYQFTEVIKRLKAKDALRFPRLARLTQEASTSEQQKWILDIKNESDADLSRFVSIYNRTHRVLHELSPFGPIPKNDEAAYSLCNDLNAMRADHQWLWNHLWQHAIFLKDKLFFVNLGNFNNSERPQIIKHHAIATQDVIIDFDPDFLADFSGEIDWRLYDDKGAEDEVSPPDSAKT